MANGIPVRLSADLAQRARQAAETADRSVTDQVEHWARLGQAVEDVVLAKTVARLKARSHDADLPARIAMADTPEGRAKALALINSRSSTRHGTDARGHLRIVRAEGSSPALPAPSAAVRSKTATPTPASPSRMKTSLPAPSSPAARMKTSLPAQSRPAARSKTSLPAPSPAARSKASARPVSARPVVAKKPGR